MKIVSAKHYFFLISNVVKAAGVGNKLEGLRGCENHKAQALELKIHISNSTAP